MPPVRFRAPPDVRPERLRTVGGVLSREDDVGKSRRLVAARGRRTSVENQRPALARAYEGQRPANREVFAGVIDRVDLAGIGKYVVLLVVDERIRLPALPKLDHD